MIVKAATVGKLYRNYLIWEKGKKGKFVRVL